MTTRQGSPFARRIAGTFATKVVSFGLNLVSTFLVARLLGPSGRGEFYLLTLVPATLLTFGQLGIPTALVFFTGRGYALGDLVRTCVRMLPAFALLAVLPAIALGGFLVRTVFAGVSELEFQIMVVIAPFLFGSMLGGAILLGRQAIGVTNLLSLGQTIGSLVLIASLVGVAGLGVRGAVGAYAVMAIAVAAATTILVRRLPASEPGAPRAGTRGLLGYGLRIYPGSLASFFSYRVDVFLLSVMLASPAQVGLYSLAVGLAELVFYVPDSVAMSFFPRVASSDRVAADEIAPSVARQTVLMTTCAALILLPVSWLAINLLLPAFVDGYLALVVLMPGVVALSVSKVLSGYVSGLGRPLPVGGVAVASLTVNVLANLALIPLFGIVGAAAASLISYSVNAAMMIVMSSRLSGTSPGRLVVPRRADAEIVVGIAKTLLREAWTVVSSALRPVRSR